MEKLAQPAKASGLPKWANYSLCVLCFLGIITGMIYWQSIKTLPNGNRYYIYDEATRKLGKICFIFRSLFLQLRSLLSWPEVLCIGLEQPDTITKQNQDEK